MVIMVQGQWRSQACLGYWRQCEEIFLLFMGFHLQDHASILVTMLLFKQDSLVIDMYTVLVLIWGSRPLNLTVCSLCELMDAESVSPWPHM